MRIIKQKKKDKAIPYRPTGVQEVEALSNSRQSVHEGGKVAIPMHRPSLNPTEVPWYSFLLDSDSTPWH
jgi:hypothetical protein